MEEAWAGMASGAQLSVNFWPRPDNIGRLRDVAFRPAR